MEDEKIQTGSTIDELPADAVRPTGVGDASAVPESVSAPIAEPKPEMLGGGAAYGDVPIGDGTEDDPDEKAALIGLAELIRDQPAGVTGPEADELAGVEVEPAEVFAWSAPKIFKGHAVQIAPTIGGKVRVKPHSFGGAEFEVDHEGEIAGRLP